MKNVENVYSTRMVADKLGVCQMTIQRLARHGELPTPDYYFRLGGYKLKLWKPETIERFQESFKPRKQGERRR